MDVCSSHRFLRSSFIVGGPCEWSVDVVVGSGPNRPDVHGLSPAIRSTRSVNCTPGDSAIAASRYREGA